MRGQSAFASAPILGAERKRKSGDKQLSRQDGATGRPAAVGRRGEVVGQIKAALGVAAAAVAGATPAAKKRIICNE